MYKAVDYFGFILWIIYLILFMNREIKRKNKFLEEYNFKMLINKPFHLIRIDSVFFLIVYLIYSNLSDNRLLPYLYVIIMITNIVYVLYDIADNYKTEKTTLKNELFNFCAIILLVISIVLCLVFKVELNNICILTLILNLFIPLWVWFINIIKNKCNK